MLAVTPTESTSREIRVAIIDDSAVMRSLIRKVLSQEPRIKVVGEAGDPYEARTMIKATSPDVVTLDIEMPRMNGLEFLDKIMRLRPMPVIMVSSLTAEGAAASIEALSLGAVECVGKPSPDHPYTLQELPAKIRAASVARIRRKTALSAPAPVHAGAGYKRIVALGASTGGVDALLNVLTRFPADAPPTVIVQHMPRAFTTTFAERLNARSAIKVVEAADGMPLERGCAYLAPGSDTHLMISSGNVPRCQLTPTAAVCGHRPSVDVLFKSLEAFAPNVVAALLTGMGRDGAEGMKVLKDAGCPTAVQDEASCVVFGMPKAALEIGAATRTHPLTELPEVLLTQARGAGHVT